MRVAALAALALAAACAPTHRWVDPYGMALDPGRADFGECQQQASFGVDRLSWYQRNRLEREALFARNPADRSFATVRLQQLEMLAVRDRQRAFEGCMEARGYRLQQVGP
jgi:hypothetical protein